ncbi:ABC1 kinase family protein [Altericroceibacterium endophyticum]|uniref:AarF/ABC1/UbiB kinase family protein n=1 Tax=Altericroceibacterium endophyticum TaxID=1808508 RepID=A0A6I4T775_9SPHN|nr:AarF/UbiB family protein [Altericroceibacterium endophyticum]MXO66072.1 AarF/ABC1/UbiB kinase family protein [Altericroceibacterium endophyticum]
MLKSIIVAARDRERLGEIALIATRFGLTSLLARFGIADSEAEEPGNDMPRRVRQALEELGPTFVKLGQILATRRDLLGEEWTAELEKLQSSAPMLPFADLRGQVEEALGDAPENIFAHFDEAPLAAASIAQVHRGTLEDGTEVAIKIRRPGIRRRMESDLRLIRQFAALAEKSSAEARRIRPHKLVTQLAEDILEELDFTREGRNADALRSDLADEQRVVVPAIHWDYSSAKLLVMDFIEGVPPREPAELRSAGIDPSRIADLGAELVLEMVLVNGRFHGDPHPGNLLCLPGDRLALLDLGSMGQLGPRRQHEFLTFLLSLRNSNPQGVADMLGLWSEDSQVSRAVLLKASEKLVARHGSGALVLSAMMEDFFPLLRKEGLTLPPDLLLIFKAMVTMDGVLSRIEPDFDLSAALQGMKGRLLANRLERLTGAGRQEALLLELSRIAEELPHTLRMVSHWLERQNEAPPQTSVLHSQMAASIRQAGAMIAISVLILSVVLAVN